MTVLRRIPELPGAGRVGRHIEHDPRSRAYGLAGVPLSSLRSVSWKRRVPPYDQGDLGSCTGNAMAGLLSTSPWPHHFHEHTAVLLYKQATALDEFPGTYPPDDVGSSGLGVCKAAKARGWIAVYRHAFSLNAALAALQDGPVITGVNWYASFDRPQGSNAELVITPGAQIRGGHEFEVRGIDVTARTIRGVQSWGPDWGDRGEFTMSWATWERLLNEQGDVTVPAVLRASPSP